MLRFGSGKYNVRDSEIIGHEQRTNSLKTTLCTVHFLDDTSENFELDHRCTGQDLLDKVFQHLELIEKDYFGLKFADVLSRHENLCWLDPTLSIRKQLQCPPYILYLRVKFYVSDPSKLHEEYTRYHFYLQLRKDISEGRLHCTEHSGALLGSYAVQSEYGDYVREEHGESYLDGFQFSPNQTASLIKKISDFHKLHKGQTPADAEYNFLDHAKRLDNYGVNAVTAQDSNLAEVRIGVASYGIALFDKSQRTRVYHWSKILEISFKRKQFFIRLYATDEARDSKDNSTVSFKLVSTSACKCLWKLCVEHHAFFRLAAAPSKPPVKGLFSLGSRYSYSGRTEYQTLEEMKRRARIERTFHRASSKTSFMRSSLATNHSGATLPSSLGGGGGRLRASIADASPLGCHFRQPTTAATSSGAVDGFRSPPSHNNRTSRSDPCSSGETNDAFGHNMGRKQADLPANGRAPPKETTFGVTSSVDSSPSDVDKWADTCSYRIQGAHPDNIIHNDSSKISRNLDDGPRYRNSPILAPKTACSPDRPTSSNSVLHYHHKLNGLVHQTNAAASSVTTLDDNLVTIRLKPDTQGRFGFNVKGGADLNHPIIVSNVILGGQADKAWPRLNEGDQVLYINGRDVTRYAHDELVRLIRGFSRSPADDLVLTVRPNAYIGEELIESDNSAVPQCVRVADYVPRSELLNRSVLLLRESLDSGAALEQFGLLYRKKSDLAITVCLQPKNASKNRYRDILPYDSTRVIIANSDSGGDYINASYVNMEIPATGIVNRYIASQGPLPHTCSDFWTVVWEQVCPTVVMLTALNEQGRPKCHRYWPDANSSFEYKHLTVRCTAEQQTFYGFCREFTITCQKTKEERLVSQLQYAIWPDHGVPDDLDTFVAFLEQVRQSRAGMVEPLLVHCSAGIGRTGVLILMETAMCLIEANEPIYPLDIVKTMRDQRAMLIQTPSQYRFVCEAICRAYFAAVVRPLAEYQKDKVVKR